MTLTTITKWFQFEAAHYLPKVAKGHKCAGMHGHGYRVGVSLQGDVCPAMGWVVDLGDVGDVCDRIKADVDHKTLNDVPGLENPTAEVLAHWVLARVLNVFPGACSVEVWETGTGYVRVDVFQ